MAQQAPVGNARARAAGEIQHPQRSKVRQRVDGHRYLAQSELQRFQLRQSLEHVEIKVHAPVEGQLRQPVELLERVHVFQTDKSHEGQVLQVALSFQCVQVLQLAGRELLG